METDKKEPQRSTSKGIRRLMILSPSIERRCSGSTGNRGGPSSDTCQYKNGHDHENLYLIPRGSSSASMYCR